MEQKRLIVAARHQKRALQLLPKTSDKLSLAQGFSSTVALLHALQDYDRAERLMNRIAGFVQQHGRDREHADFSFQRAKVDFAQGRRESALAELQQARTIVEEALPKVRRRDQRRLFFALQKSIFELNVEVLMADDKAAKALQLVESYKARTLEEVLNQIRGQQDGSAELIAQRATLHKQILDSAVTWYGNGGQQDNNLISDIRTLSSALEKINTRLDQTWESGREPKTTNALPAVPSLNSDDELMAYYFIGEHRGWLWLVSNAGLSAHELPGADQIAPLAEQVKAHISTHPRARQNVTAWQQRKALVDLGSILLSPIADSLASGGFRNLTIVPDGPLNGLPFAPLRPGDSSSPLIEYVALSYAHSNESQKALNLRSSVVQQSENPQILVVSDPIDNQGESEFSRIPHTQSEAEAIRQQFSNAAQVLGGETADKETVLEALTSEYSILHFATHGLLNSEEPSLSGLMFSKTSRRPNFWLAPEISAADIQAGLVVLSACESAVGKGVSGEGMLSLSRAFLEGGASHVIGTLWKVEDAATAQLVSQFYSNLVDDSLAISIALQKAQLTTYQNRDNDWRDPYFWAGFQLQGGWNTLAYATSRKNTD